MFKDTNVFAEVVFEDPVHVLDGALRCVVVKHPHDLHVLLGNQVVQGSDVLPNLDETTAVRRAHVPQSLGRPSVYLCGKASFMRTVNATVVVSGTLRLF